VWLAGQTILNKLISFVGQLALAWLLTEHDFGLVGMAYTVAAFGNVLRDGGLQQVLIHRHASFERWAAPAFTLSLALGVAAGLLMLAAAPLAARWYGYPQLVGLTAVLALNAPLTSLSTVPMARVQSQMRFGLLATLNTATAVCMAGLSIALARAGFGAYSFVIPWPAVALLRAVALLVVVPPTFLRRGAMVRRWRFLYRDGAMLVGTAFGTVVLTQADYIVLGLTTTTAVVGTYFFAFNLSTQMSQVLAQNMAGVMFPALSQLPTPNRQIDAFLRASRLMAFVAMPACLLQVALAEPALRLLYADKWIPAVPVLQILSVGMGIAAVGTQSASLLKAQGRFGTEFGLVLASAVLFVGFVVAGAWIGEARGNAAVGVAVATTAALAVSDPVRMRIAIGPGGGRWHDVWPLYVTPMALAAAAIAPGALLAGTIAPAGRTGALVAAAIIAAASLLLYPLALRYAAPTVWSELYQRLQALRPSRGTRQ
jgi:PST family polysaccharide transporter